MSEPFKIFLQIRCIFIGHNYGIFQSQKEHYKICTDCCHMVKLPVNANFKV